MGGARDALTTQQSGHFHAEIDRARAEVSASDSSFGMKVKASRDCHSSGYNLLLFFQVLLKKQLPRFLLILQSLLIGELIYRFPMKGLNR